MLLEVVDVVGAAEVEVVLELVVFADVLVVFALVLLAVVVSDVEEAAAEDSEDVVSEDEVVVCAATSFLFSPTTDTEASARRLKLRTSLTHEA